MKVAVVDLETTGTDPFEHEILEIGAVVFDSQRPDEYETIDLKVKPTHIETANPRALEVNGYDPKAWDDAIPLNDALEILLQKCSGAVFMAYNVSFDWNFINEAYKKSPVRNPFNYHKFCLMTVAWAKLPNVRSLKLRDICEQLGIPPEPTVHRAVNGALRAYELYRKAMQ